MNTTRLVPIALLGLMLLAPATLTAQSRGGHGKIDGVEREARRSGNSNNDDDDDDDGGFFGFIIGLFHSDSHDKADPDVTLPPTPGRGYQDYPYADRAEEHPFLREHVLGGHGFGNLSATYFDDNAIGGTLQAGQVAWEGALEEAYASVEWTTYREPTPTDTDWLHTLRLGVGGIGHVSHGYVKVGPALRLVALDNGTIGLGPDLEVGAEILPGRPWGVGGTARGALLKWDGRGSWTGMADLTAHASVYLGRVELMAGWRYVVIGSAPAFNGPTAGMRVWF